MSAHRLSKLQKWILVECYKVTVLRERMDKSLARCRYFDMFSCPDNIEPVPAHLNLYNCKKIRDEATSPCPAFEFTQMDIYSRYYEMKPSRERPSQDEYRIRFERTPDSDKVYNAVTRSLKNLEKKAYVDLYGNHMRIIVLLTDVGKTFVKEWIAKE